MTALLKKHWWTIYALVLLADTLCLVFNNDKGHFWFKILLMPILFVGLINAKKQFDEKNWRIILAGLILAWAGDVLLLFAATQELFFIIGLVCFLITHAAYIRYFYCYNGGKTMWLLKHPVITLLVVFYSLLLYGFLLPSLGNLKIPVGFYTAVISLMLLQALASQKFLPPQVYQSFVVGALVFVISDSLLAWSKFHARFTGDGALIMLTYGIAQGLIGWGAIKNSDAVAGH